MGDPQVVPDVVEQAVRVCGEALMRPDLSRLAAALEELGAGEDDSVRMVHHVTEGHASHEPIAQLSARLSAAGFASEDGGLERLLLFRTACRSLPRVATVPVCASVKTMLCEEFGAWAISGLTGANRPRVGSHRFSDLCMLASLRRFPAGQFDWVRSGLPLSYLLGVGLMDLPAILLVVATRLRGRSPVFFSHLGYRRVGQSLTEIEANRAYHRMARSMALQADIRGLVASSWFRSPDTHRVSPHLAWVNRVVLDNGGCVAVHGPAAADSGVFATSASRRRLYESGSFTPTLGLVIWPRRAMLRWADSHPELAD